MERSPPVYEEGGWWWQDMEKALQEPEAEEGAEGKP